jgi:hypothetical protein
VALSALNLAADADLARYEQEIVAAAAKYGVSLDSVRDAVLDELLEETHTDGVDPDKVIDDDSERAKALRRYATRKALRIFFEDVSDGRDGSVLSRKAERAAAHEERARAALHRAGWPVDSNDNAVLDDEDPQPKVWPTFSR